MEGSLDAGAVNFRGVSDLAGAGADGVVEWVFVLGEVDCSAEFVVVEAGGDCGEAQEGGVAGFR